MDKKVTFKKMITLRIPEGLLKKIDEAAEKKYLNRSDFIIQTILKELKVQENEG